MVVKVGWRRSRWWLVVTIVENFLGAEPFRSVSEGTGGTGLGAWADLSRVAQSMGRSRIGEKDRVSFSTARRFCIEEFVSIGGVGWRGDVAVKNNSCRKMVDQYWGKAEQIFFWPANYARTEHDHVF